MKKRIALASLLFVFSNPQFGQHKKQPNIHFDTNFFEALNHWVVLPQTTGNLYLLGYIYLDEIEGFTFALEELVEINASKNWIVKSREQNYIVKKQFDIRKPMVLMVPSEKIKELQLPKKPKWLKLPDEESAAYLIAKGFHYNAIGKSELAISFLELAYQKNPSAANAAFELAYAYNSTQQFEKAIAILHKALTTDSENYILYRELGYSLVKTEKWEEAERIYDTGLLFCNDIQKAEMAVDMAQVFFELKDDVKHTKWSNLAKYYAEKDKTTIKNGAVIAKKTADEN